MRVNDGPGATLDDEVIDAGVENRDHILFGVAAGRKHHRRHGTAQFDLQACKHFPTRQVGHYPVEKADIETPAFDGMRAPLRSGQSG